MLFSRSVVSDSVVTPWTVACQPLLSMGFPRQEYWSELPFPSPGDPPGPGIEPASPALQVGFHQESPGLGWAPEFAFLTSSLSKPWLLL